MRIQPFGKVYPVGYFYYNRHKFCVPQIQTHFFSKRFF